MNNDLRKKISREYAASLANENHVNNMELRKILGFTDIDYSEKINKKEASEKADQKKVGIWVEKTENDGTYYVRDVRCKDMFYRWANVTKIKQKTNKYRIAFLGESVARGFLLEPYVSLSKTIQLKIQENLLDREVEVVDLACLGIGLSELETLSKEVQTLEPDMIIVFAGNNWNYMLRDFSDDELRELRGEDNQEDILEKMNDITKRKTVSQINSFMDTLHRLYQKNNIPVFFIIPEFNLKDWKHNFGGELFPFYGVNKEESLTVIQEIKTAIAHGDITNAKEKSKRLIELDEFSSLGYEYMAHCKLLNGDLSEARMYYEKARDVGVYLPYDVRGCYSFVKETIINKAKEHNFFIVNLPELFKKSCNTIPGYDLFLDYCHLNLKGIQFVIKYIVESILSYFFVYREIVTHDILIEKEKLSKTYFLAALHCAHHNQPYEVLYNLCSESLALSKDISNLMISYMKLTTKKVSLLLNAQMYSVIDTGVLEQNPFFIQDQEYRTLDLILVQAILDSLSQYGIHLADEITNLRIKEHKVSECCPIDLLESSYRDTSYEEKRFFSSYSSVDKNAIRPIYKRMKANDKGYFFIADPNNTVKLNATIRNISKINTIQKLTIMVNNVLIEEFEVKPEWTNFEFKIDKNILEKNGVNRICFHQTDSLDINIQREIRLYDDVVNKLYGGHCQIYKLVAVIN